MTTTTAAVLGGAGFLGSHLVDALLARGARVIVLDSFLTGRAENLPEHPDLDVRTIDVTTELIVDTPLDLVAHLASAASPVDYARYPIQTLKAGALGTHKALGLARAHGATLLLASTSEVYGDPEVSPQPETYAGRVDPVGPRGAYDEAKRYAEALVTAYRRVHGVDTRIARIFNSYGPRMRMDDGRVVPAFVDAILSGRPLPVGGDGRQTRSLCYVEDTVAGLIALLDGDHPGPVNIGNDHEIAIADLAEITQQVAGTRVGTVRIDRPPADPQQRRPDLGLAASALGWRPRVDLETGLARTIGWARQQLS